MRTLELFSGKESFSKYARTLGHDTFTIDNNPIFSPDLCADISTLSDEYISKFKNIYMVWCSPPCECFSIASRISRNWKKHNGKVTPISPKADEAIALLKKTIHIINLIKPKYWFIENPRGMMRMIIDDCFADDGVVYKRFTITYCQYGIRRMKPTDIWTNSMIWNPRPICKNGAPYHASAPRGSRTSTTGMATPADRAIIPEELIKEIFEVHDGEHFRV